MLALIDKNANGYTATFVRNLEHPREKVWEMLTDNNQLKKWFPELQADELKKGGAFKFDMGDGSFEEMEILGFEQLAILEYTWGDDIVRFELDEENGRTKLKLIEKINEITDHTPRDLAGWHVCLDVISRLLDGNSIGSRKEEWEKWYEEYKTAVNSVQK
ncbi:SRPBCC family protein [Bacillus sp. ISL-47]|uniref:SRPBCC family protein n=1 Tax=Bacillus sp. ISL-47 TaxID=2819130 RepID=UPI001BE9B364|nr:SRPBCC family protein [Bacillus sp. ISL-47]MBT2688708.1 SRPBCC family protein [Bacillus sp. ISL-47]MBT2707392.1 SRPBCC family protein [Pseudomonas sp. ISL-84]